MKLTYLANVNLPDNWAHSVQIMKMCEAFAQSGAEVTLVVPLRNLPIKTPIFEYYTIKPVFRIVRVPCMDIFQSNPHAVFFWLRYISFLISARLYLAFSSYDVLYTRELYAPLLFKNVFMERHSFPSVPKALHTFLFKRVSGLVVLTSFIKSRMVALGISEKKIFVVPDAVRMEDFAERYTREEARKKLSLSQNDYLVGYIGTLKTMGMEKGLKTAIESLEFLSTIYMLYVVGGTTEDIQFYKSYAKEKNLVDRVIFVGSVAHTDVPLHMGACDILTAPFPENEHYSFFMSPLKIFEYMASNRPIVSTALPSIKEVLTDGKNAVLVQPSDPRALAEAIAMLHDNPAYGEKISDQAYDDVASRHTWKIRARNIIDFINTVMR